MRCVAMSVFSSVLCACSGNGGVTDDSLTVNSVGNSAAVNSTGNSAAVTELEVSGDSRDFSFAVTVTSPDLGCSQYADWWEVIRPDGSLVYRRILTHSHVDEQPFTRSGGPVAISADEEVIVRVHMNNLNYSEQVYTGSVSQGFSAATLDAAFAQTLEFVEPLPDGCAF